MLTAVAYGRNQMRTVTLRSVVPKVHTLQVVSNRVPKVLLQPLWYQTGDSLRRCPHTLGPRFEGHADECASIPTHTHPPI